MLAYHFGLKFKENSDDTMVMHYVLDENAQHGLKGLAIKYTQYGDYDAALEEFKKSYCKQHGIIEENFTYDLIPFDIISTYAAIDTAVTLELYNKFRPVISKAPRLEYVYTQILIPGVKFLLDMEEVGIPMSEARLRASESYLDKWIDEAKQEVYAFEAVQKFEKDTGSIYLLWVLCSW